MKNKKWGGLLLGYEANRVRPCALGSFYSFSVLDIWPVIPLVSSVSGHTYDLFCSPTFEDKYALIDSHNLGFLNIAYQSVSSAQDPSCEAFWDGNIPRFELP